MPESHENERDMRSYWYESGKSRTFPASLTAAQDWALNSPSCNWQYYYRLLYHENAKIRAWIQLWFKSCSEKDKIPALFQCPENHNAPYCYAVASDGKHYTLECTNHPGWRVYLELDKQWNYMRPKMEPLSKDTSSTNGLNTTANEQVRNP